MTMTTPPERTLAIAVAEVRFGIQYGALNERFWHHLDTALNLVQISCGALALAGAIAQGTQLVAVGAVVLACVSAVQLTLQPTRRSIAFRDARRLFHELNARAWQLSLQDLDAALERLRADAPPGLAALLMPAQNIVHRQHGGSDVRPLTLWERLALALA